MRETLDRERQELTAIVGGATDAIIQVDEDCKVVRMNPAARQLLGPSADDGIGQPCREMLQCEQAGAHADDVCRSRRSSNPADRSPTKKQPSWMPREPLCPLRADIRARQATSPAGAFEQR
ncbi:MAG TPA: PAS domain-containing protein [Chloroflexota bacterium]|nr:PAS domain-containing protein [Chloroflexota bacterium]